MNVKLVMFNTDGDRRAFTLGGGESIIGRDAECALRIPLAEVSRRHARVNLGNGKLTVKDLESSNGTYINLERTEEEREIQAGDKLSIGPVVFTVQIDGKPESIEPVRTRLDRHPDGPKSNSSSDTPISEDELLSALQDPMGDEDV